MGQSVGGAKTGEPREKPPDTPASRTWLVSHVARAGLEPTPDTAVRWSRIEWLRNSALNRSATGAAMKVMLLYLYAFVQKAIIIGISVLWKVYFKELKTKFILLTLKHIVQRSHSEALAWKNAHYPILILLSNVVFCCLESEKSGKKSLNAFSLAANILK